MEGGWDGPDGTVYINGVHSATVTTRYAPNFSHSPLSRSTKTTLTKRFSANIFNFNRGCHVSGTQLQALHRRVKVKWTGRDQCHALWIGQYSEVREHFAGKISVSRAQITDWLRGHVVGKRFWLRLCVRCGLPTEPFNSILHEIEHVHNSAWGGSDHYLNYMILAAPINNSIEFRTGPCHLKMIMIGRTNFALVQRFARWHQQARDTTPRDSFLHTEVDQAVVSLLGGLSQPKLGFKRIRED